MPFSHFCVTRGTRLSLQSYVKHLISLLKGVRGLKSILATTRRMAVRILAGTAAVFLLLHCRPPRRNIQPLMWRPWTAIWFSDSSLAAFCFSLPRFKIINIMTDEVILVVCVIRQKTNQICMKHNDLCVTYKFFVWFYCNRKYHRAILFMALRHIF